MLRYCLMAEKSWQWLMLDFISEGSGCSSYFNLMCELQQNNFYKEYRAKLTPNQAHFVRTEGNCPNQNLDLAKFYAFLTKRDKSGLGGISENFRRIFDTFAKFLTNVD